MRFFVLLIPVYKRQTKTARHQALRLLEILHYSGVSFQINTKISEGTVTVAFLPSLNMVSGLVQDGELTENTAVEVSSQMESYPSFWNSEVRKHSRAYLFLSEIKILRI